MPCPWAVLNKSNFHKPFIRFLLGITLKDSFWSIDRETERMREREGESVLECMKDIEYERERVTREWERARECKRERQTERGFICVCVCVVKRERESFQISTEREIKIWSLIY